MTKIISRRLAGPDDTPSHPDLEVLETQAARYKVVWRADKPRGDANSRREKTTDRLVWRRKK